MLLRVFWAEFALRGEHIGVLTFEVSGKLGAEFHLEYSETNTLPSTLHSSVIANDVPPFLSPPVWCEDSARSKLRMPAVAYVHHISAWSHPRRAGVFSATFGLDLRSNTARASNALRPAKPAKREVCNLLYIFPCTDILKAVSFFRGTLWGLLTRIVSQILSWW